MKIVTNTCVLLLMLCTVISSCKKDVRTLNENLDAVNSLTLPANETNVKLRPSDEAASLIFNWSATSAEDGELVIYEVAFDKEGGDFSNPVYKVVSDGGGVQPQVTISHKDLTKIAASGGINSSSVGKIKWAVIASKASNRKVSAETRLLQLERPAGFAEVPSDLYLTGSATENGDDVTKAIKLKKLEGGLFEIYTSLKPGTYQLTDKAAADGKKFYVEGALIKEGTTPVSVTDGTKMCHLKYDFNVATVVNAEEIQSVGLYMSAYGNEIGQLMYAGNGIWQSGAISVVFYQFSWGRDERYKFALHTSAGVKYLGSSNVDNGSPVGQSASYFYLNPVTNDQWNNTYKFNPSADNHNVRATVKLSPNGSYTHEVITL